MLKKDQNSLNSLKNQKFLLIFPNFNFKSKTKLAL